MSSMSLPIYAHQFFPQISQRFIRKRANELRKMKKAKKVTDANLSDKNAKKKKEVNRKKPESEKIIKLSERSKRITRSAKKDNKKVVLGFTKNVCLCGDFGLANENGDFAQITVEKWRLQSVQSPIVLKHDESNPYDHFEPLEFHGHWADEGTATFNNTGYTATLRFFNREMPFLQGGPLHEDRYIFEQLHFHWSDDDHSGCEHIFEGQAYSMEAHAVHYNEKYGSFKNAYEKHDGLAVVAFFLKATDNDDNPCFKKLTEAVKDIVKINSETDVPADCLTWISEQAQCKGYYTYQGSLTTEPYNESVTWIIYPTPIHISREQVSAFRNMKSTPCEKHNIVKNVRPIQTPAKKLEIYYARSHRKSE